MGASCTSGVCGGSTLEPGLQGAVGQLEVAHAHPEEWPEVLRLADPPVLI